MAAQEYLTDRPLLAGETGTGSFMSGLVGIQNRRGDRGELLDLSGAQVGEQVAADGPHMMGRSVLDGRSTEWRQHDVGAPAIIGAFDTFDEAPLLHATDVVRQPAARPAGPRCQVAEPAPVVLGLGQGREYVVVGIGQSRVSVEVALYLTDGKQVDPAQPSPGRILGLVEPGNVFHAVTLDGPQQVVDMSTDRARIDDMSTTWRTALVPAPRVHRLAQLTTGLVLFGISLAMMVSADLGLDPWDVLHQGLARTFDLRLGAVVIAASLVVLLLWLPLRERPGLGTLMNAVLVGLVFEAAIAVLGELGSATARWMMLSAAIGLNAVATSMYVGAGLGPGPRDGLMTGLAARGYPVRRVRTGIEVTVLGAGWLLGGTVGLGTVLFAVLIGPLIHVTLPRFTIARPSVTAPAPILR